MLFNKNRDTLKYPEGKTAASYTIPSSVTTLGDASLNNTRLTSLYNQSTTPQTLLYGSAFSGVTLANVDLYVPVLSIAAYRDSAVWQDFKSIQALPNSATGVAITNCPAAALVVGASHTLGKIISPSDAYNQNVTWSSSDTLKAKVGSSGVVTAVAAGTATITVTTQDGNKTAQCAVTVRTSGGGGGDGDGGGTAVTADALPKLAIYPNPAGDMLYISDEFAGVAEIYDLAGTLVLTATSNAINISRLPAGIYVVKAGGKAAKVVRR